MPSLLNLHEMLQLVEYGFDRRTAMQEDFVMQQEQTVDHVALEMSH